MPVFGKVKLEAFHTIGNPRGWGGKVKLNGPLPDQWGGRGVVVWAVVAQDSRAVWVKRFNEFGALAAAPLV